MVVSGAFTKRSSRRSSRPKPVVFLSVRARTHFNELFVTLSQPYSGTTPPGNAPGGPHRVKNFSIFEQALNFSGLDKTENLGEIASLARRDFAERESFICHTTTASVEYACLLIENAVLLRTNRAGRVYAGVEKLSSLQPIIDRYMRIADVSEVVYLFGQDDWRPPRHPN